MIDLEEGVRSLFEEAAARGTRWTLDEPGSALHRLNSDSYLGHELSRLEGLRVRREERRRVRKARYDRLRAQKKHRTARVEQLLQIVPLRANTVSYKTQAWIDHLLYPWASRKISYYRCANDNQPKRHLYGQTTVGVTDVAPLEMPVGV